MIDITTLLPELKKLVTDLSEDMLKRVGDNAEINDGLKNAYQQIEKGGRTAQAYEVWLEDYLDQVAVAWVLSCVFVRFMEDNDLVDDCYLAGEAERRSRADGEHELYFREHPHHSDREYFEYVFDRIGTIPACCDLLSKGKTPLWAVGPSGDASMMLLAFWREIDAGTGKLKRSFVSQDCDTRFLGDLYQDLSEAAQKKYALLQTPEFVEEFILDRTLDPAIDEFGLKDVRLIDPTCGSGHFLLGAFDRLFNLWMKQQDNEIVAAQQALNGVWGVDINPFAVAIAKFRLIVTALTHCKITKLTQAPGWNIHLASGDSLLFGKRPSFGGQRVGISQQLELFEVPSIYATEDRIALQEILGQAYHAVVGNPPYITVKDKSQNGAYRKLYQTCHRKYSLGVPFTQRFWELALQDGEANGKAGFVGMITANSFMKREFGTKLIEQFFPKVDLTHVVDSAGAYIPGHGTPTVILFGRSRKPVGDVVRAVLGIRGEPSTPDIPANGCVWQSIQRNISQSDSEDEFTSSADVPRLTFCKHPWSLGGGGAADLQKRLDSSANAALSEVADVIGVFGMTNADEVFLCERKSFIRQGVEPQLIRDLLMGDEVRDWLAVSEGSAIFPYNDDETIMDVHAFAGMSKWMWPAKTVLGNRATFSKGTYFSEGLQWWKWHQVAIDRIQTPFTIVLPNIATHNHFVLERDKRLCNVTAIIVKLAPEASEDDHLAIVGLLNSSVACFWIKQRFQTKGSSGMGRGIYDEKWEFFYQISGTGLGAFPLPEGKPLELARELDRLSRELTQLLPLVAIDGETPTTASMEKAKSRSNQLRGRMVALQEELDWQCYRLFGLTSDDLCCDPRDLPEVRLGERAFEICMARRAEKGELQTSWFERHDSTLTTEVPEHWSEDYRKTVEARIQASSSVKQIGLLERPENKRRWNFESWERQEQRALREWLADRLESDGYWPEPKLQSVAQLADRATSDPEFRQVAALYRAREDFDLGALVSELVHSEAVPFLPVLRYKPSGLRKRKVWEDNWTLQRREDAGENVADIKVPPRYASADFQKSEYWRLRGKLDVPKERFISFPNCGTESDPTLVVGWAGWDHLQQATALVGYYDARKREGWLGERLKPLLAGIDQLLPWIHQWHPEIDSEYNETAGTSFQTLLESEAQELGLTLEDIRDWTPPKKTTRRKRKAT